MLSRLQRTLLQSLGILGHSEPVDAFLDVTIHEGGAVVDGVAGAVVGNAALGVFVGANLGLAVTGGNHRLAACSDVVDVLLVLLIIYKGTQARERTFLILRLVARFGAFD